MKYQLLPALSAEDYSALEASIVAHGVLVPVEYDENGDIIDGHHRVAICESLGLVDWPRFVRKGLSEAEKRTLSRELNVSRRHLSTAQKQAIIADQLRDTPSISSRAIAAMLGVDHKTVGKVRSQLESTGEIPQLKEVEGRDGKNRPARRPIKTAFLPDADNRRELMKVAKVLRSDQQKARHQVRLAHMAMIAEKGRATAPGKLDRAYPVYYADPPWKFGVRSEETGREKSAENHYPTMTTDEIVSLMVDLIGPDEDGDAHPAGAARYFVSYGKDAPRVGKSYPPGEDVPVGGKKGLSDEDVDRFESQFGTWKGKTLSDADRIANLTARNKELELELARAGEGSDSENAKLRAQVEQLETDNQVLAARVKELEEAATSGGGTA